MDNIGILGSTGEIGKRVVELLHKKFTIKATYHQKSPSKMIDQVKYFQVDVEKKQELQKFIEECDIVVNCAGASFLTSETIAKATLEAGVVYIDPFGAESLEKKLIECKDKGLAVLSSGCFPGMTGILMCVLCETLDKVNEIYGIHIDNQVPSLYGIVDFILSGIKGFGESGCYYYKGSKKRDKNYVEIRDYENNEFMTQKYYTAEIDRIAKKYKPESAIWYAPVLSDEIMHIMQKAVWSYMDSKEIEVLKQCAQQIRQIVSKEIGIKRNCEINITVIGYVQEEKKKKNIVLKAQNSSDISAVVLCSVIESIINKKMKPGIYYAPDIVAFHEMKSIIAASKIQVYCNDEIFKNEIGAEIYEEGYI